MGLSKIKDHLKNIFGQCVFHKKLVGVEYVFFDKVEAIPVADWDRLFNDSEAVCATLDYLRCYENSITAPHQIRYLIIYDGDEPVAAFYFQLYNVSNFSVKQLLNEDYFQSLFEKLKNLNEEKLFGTNGNHRYVVINGNLFSSETPGFRMAENDNSAPKWEWSKVLELLKDSVDKQAYILCCISKDYDGRHTRLGEHLMKAGFKPFEIDPVMTLEITWHKFDEYLSALSTKYRTRIKSVLEKSKSLTIKSLSTQEIQEHHIAIDRLLQEVFRNAPVRLANVNVLFFVEQKKTFKDNYFFDVMFHEGEIVGFYSALKCEQTLTAQFVGFDYKLNKALSLYFRMLIEYIRYALDHNCTKVQFGRDALEIKSTLGAVPVPLKLYLTVPGMFASFLVDPFLRIAKARTWIQRQPFKNTNNSIDISVSQDGKS